MIVYHSSPDSATIQAFPQIDSQESTPLSSPSVMLTSKLDYDTSAFRYEKLADMRLRNFDTVVFGGYGAQIKVRYDCLSVEYTRGHDTNKMLKMSRGTHK